MGPQFEELLEVAQEGAGVRVVVLGVEDQVGVHQVEPCQRCADGRPRRRGVVGTLQVRQHVVAERLDADADRGEPQLAQRVEARRGAVRRQHLDGALPCHRQRLDDRAEQVGEQGGRPTADVERGEPGLAWDAGAEVAARLGQQRGEVAFGLAKAGNHLVVGAERADPRAERHVEVRPHRAVAQPGQGVGGQRPPTRRRVRVHGAILAPDPCTGD